MVPNADIRSLVVLVCGTVASAAAIAGSMSRLLQAAEDTGSTNSPESLQFYREDVQPILRDHCYKCHGGREVEGSLRLTTQEAILKGGDSGPAVDTEKPDASLLLSAVR